MSRSPDSRAAAAVVGAFDDLELGRGGRHGGRTYRLAPRPSGRSGAPRRIRDRPAPGSRRPSPGHRRRGWGRPGRRPRAPPGVAPGGLLGRAGARLRGRRAPSAVRQHHQANPGTATRATASGTASEIPGVHPSPTKNTGPPDPDREAPGHEPDRREVADHGEGEHQDDHPRQPVDEIVAGLVDGAPGHQHDAGAQREDVAALEEDAVLLHLAGLDQSLGTTTLTAVMATRSEPRARRAPSAAPRTTTTPTATVHASTTPTGGASVEPSETRRSSGRTACRDSRTGLRSASRAAHGGGPGTVASSPTG